MRRLCSALLLLALVACSSGDSASDTSTTVAAAPTTATSGPGPTSVAPSTAQLAVTSDAFAEGARIPKKYTCDGDNVSPPLTWTAAPEGTADVALVVDDPDAPDGIYTHWVLFGLAPSRRSVAEGEVPFGARQARNSDGKATYFGPCPPSGAPHQYRFTIYALRKPLALENGAMLGSVEPAIRQAGVIVTGTLVATYSHA